MSDLSAFWGRTKASRWLRLLLGIPAACGILIAVLWIAMRVGALDRFPWPQHWVFDGDPEAFVACFEARALIAQKGDSGFVTLFSERPEDGPKILLKMGASPGYEGSRSVELVTTFPGFMLRDLHYLPDRAPLSQPLYKRDWFVVWRCARLAR